MIVGHQKIWQFLKQSAAIGRISHAYLFSGQEKLGKKTVALEFTSFLFGQSTSGLVDGKHPDFIFIRPEKKEIKISQIKEAIWRLALKPSVAPCKIAIIDQAHCLNQEAQNCLLKTLEEPRGKAILFLITEYPEVLFATIRSRCQIIKFYPVKKEEIENYLRVQGISENQLKEIIKNSEGRPGLAVDFSADPQKLKIKEKIISDLIQISDSDLSSRFQYVKKISEEKQDFKEILEIWQRYFREILISNLNKKSSKPSFEKLRNILKLIQNTNSLISTTNVNPRLALEILILEL